MNNRITVAGVILPSEAYGLRPYIVRDTAVFPQDITGALKDCDPSKDITLEVNSPGGVCASGFAIIDAVSDWCRANGRKCHVEIGARACSMAAVIAFAFDGDVAVHDGTMVMFHSSRTLAEGTASQIRDVADALDVIDSAMARTIARRTGKTEAEAREWIEGTKETFLGSKQLLSLGLAGSVIGAPAEPKPTPAVALTGFKSFVESFGLMNDAGVMAAVACAEDLDNHPPADPEPPAEPQRRRLR